MSHYDEVDIEDMEFREDDQTYYYPCPCGDLFRISKELIDIGERVAICPSCSLTLLVVADDDDD